MSVSFHSRREITRTNAMATIRISVPDFVLNVFPTFTNTVTSQNIPSTTPGSNSFYDIAGTGETTGTDNLFFFYSVFYPIQRKS